MKHWLMTVTVLLCSVAVNAYDFEVGGICYAFISDTDLMVTSKGNPYNPASEKYSGSITIPSSVTYEGNTYSVTSIGNQAFSGCSNLTSVSIPDGVTTIKDGVFERCSSLSSITIPKSVTEIGYAVFCDCANLTSIVVAEGNTVYDSRNECNAIIAQYSSTLIAGCSTTIIPENVTSIGEYAFYQCTSLTSIIIPEKVTSIGDEAFYECSGLTSITCKATVPLVTSGAFYGVDKSIPVYVQASLVNAYKAADGWKDFANIQPILKAYGTCGDNLTWKLTDEGELIIEGIGKMEDYSAKQVPWAEHKGAIKKVFIKEGVTSVGSYAFAGYDKLTDVIISNGVTSIGERTFYYCENLATIRIPSSVTEFGKLAFPDKIVNIHVESVEWWINYGVKQLLRGDRNTTLFLGDDLLTKLNIPSAIKSIPDGAFCNCNSIISVTIENGVTEIGCRTFQNCI